MSLSKASSCAVDTSAIAAICFQEPGFEMYRAALASYDAIFMSTSTRLELGIVSTQREIVGLAQEILNAYQIQIVSFDEQQCLLAIAAFERFGKGRHQAGLNFGDCCSYALAMSRQLPLLFKGDDFAKTDVKDALAM
jgi:ribonuclease VapC